MILTPIDWFALALVIIIGLPHGAFDAAISLSMISSKKKITRFTGILLSYLLLAVLVILVWKQFPEISLLIFLIISVMHFGMADFSAYPTNLKWPHIIAHGGIVAIWLPIVNKQEVMQLFSILTNSEAPLLWESLTILFIFWFISGILHLWETLRFKHHIVTLELFSLILLAYFAPPLVTFAVYFCFIHSRRHFTFVWGQLQQISSKKMIISSAVILSSSSWMLGGGLYWYLNLNMTASDAALQTIFIGLAALTVPHMMLIDLMFRPHSDKIKNKN